MRRRLVTRLAAATLTLAFTLAYLFYNFYIVKHQVEDQAPLLPTTPIDSNNNGEESSESTLELVQSSKVVDHLTTPAAYINLSKSTSALHILPSAVSNDGPAATKPNVTTSPQHVQSIRPSSEIPMSSNFKFYNISGITPLPSSPSSTPSCLPYVRLQKLHQSPLSAGKREFPYSRPSPECRTFSLPSLEKLIDRMKGVIKDPDLFRLFENAYPNTLDTTIRWRGYANATDPVTGDQVVTDEELAYVITGDIDAMWLRDSASQIYSYIRLLEPSSDPDSLASLWRGVINSHARYIIISPYCHSFQPPPESGIKPQRNSAFKKNQPKPPYNPIKVYDCKWELDSLASFLQISTAYYQRTGDLAFFQKYSWVSAVSAAVAAAGAMRLGTYAPNGEVEESAWTFTGWTNRGTETLSNDGLGNPTKENGMVRSAFRPSDDACIYQLLVPANMMWAKYLEEASLIMEKLNGEEAKNLTTTMREFAFGIRKAIDRDAVIHHRDFGDIWAYEIDGYGGVNLMDDANIPSLLSIPLFNYTQSSFPLPSPADGEPRRNNSEIYSNTRRFALSKRNPYFSRGPVLSAIGGPHVGPGKPWPMAAIVRALTANIAQESVNGTPEDVEEEVKQQIRMLLDSTSGTGVVHESVDAWKAHVWSRAWFGWANGLFGELLLKISLEDEEAGRKDESILSRTWQ